MIVNKLKNIKNQLELRYLPQYYKRKFFSTIDSLNWSNIKSRNIENELLLLPYLMSKNGGFMDIGANLGQYVFVANKILDSNKIIAFEPNPDLAARLRTIFPETKILEYAISDRPGNTKFKIPFFNDREIHTRGTLKLDHHEVDETNSRLIDVQIETLDNLSKNIEFQVALVKIDVEGAEYDVIQGAGEFIKKHNPVFLIEIEQRHHSEDIKLFLKSFTEKYDYDCLYFDTVAQQLKTDIFNIDISQIQNLGNHGKNRFFINNFIFIPRSGPNSMDADSVNQKIKLNI